MRFPHIIRALVLVRPLGLAGALFSLLILAGYALNIHLLFLSPGGGPAAHPLSALILALAGLGACRWRLRGGKRATMLAGCVVLGIAAARLAGTLPGALSQWLAPTVGEALAGQAPAGHPIAMGVNTAFMGLFFGAGLIAAARNRYALAQQAAFVGLAFPMVSVTGYAYGIERFYGQMALGTVVAGLMAGFAILLTGAHRSFLRAILSPWVGGKVARVQIVLGYSVPFLIGYFLALTVARNPLELFGLFVVLISAFISALVSFTAVIQEQVDRSRRSAERRLQIVATRDSLTGLPNRHSFYDQAHWLLERGVRSGEGLAILMLDIDFFKHINDTFGHPAGDAVLRGLAGAARQILRRQDLMARFGGEEFVVLLPATRLNGAMRLAEKLRAHVAATAFLPDEAVTVSIGCAEYVAGDSLESLVARADAGLYQAKRAGRNAVATVESASSAGAWMPA